MTGLTAGGDMDRLLTMAAAVGIGGGDRLVAVTIPGAPWSKSRPRFGRGRTYTKPEDIDAETRTGFYLRQACREPFVSNVGMACIFFRPNRQRIDADNLLKHVCDAGNKILWADDSQCTAIMGVLELDADNPRTVVILGEHNSTLTRGTAHTVPCQVCGKAVAIQSRMAGHPPKTCSRKCSMEIRGYESLAEEVPCAQCAQPFRRKVRTAIYCSEECRRASLSAKRKSAGRPFSKCEDCGIDLTHHRGGRCRACWVVDIGNRKRASEPQSPRTATNTLRLAPSDTPATSGGSQRRRG